LLQIIKLQTIWIKIERASRFLNFGLLMKGITRNGITLEIEKPVT